MKIGFTKLDDLRTRSTALYHDLPMTPENTRALRALLWGLLGNLLASDYLNHWNEAREGPDAGRFLLEEAETAIDKALATDPHFALAHYARGLMQRARGDHVGAMAAFDDAIRSDSNFARAYAQKGSELINIGHPEQALEPLQMALKLGPRDRSLGMFYWNIGRAHFFTQRYADAIPYLKKATKKRPNLLYGWLYLASAYALIGKNVLAQKTLRALRECAEFHGLRFSLESVKDYEMANPAGSPVVRNGRRRFHEGLIKAGLEAA